MIKSWKLFNESVYFEGSKEFLDIKNKYSLKKEDIKEYIQDLEDNKDIKIDNFYNTVSKFNDEEITIISVLILRKLYKNKSSEIEEYMSFLKEQLDDINYILSVCESISRSEDLEIAKLKIGDLPFQGGQNSKESPLSLSIVFQRTIETDEISKAHKEYMKKDNPEREAYESVIKELVKYGIPKEDAEKLVDLHPDWEDMDYIIFGFLTNNEILSIATYNKELKRLFFERNDMIHAVEYYQDGQCNEYLE
jgi:hypothetical protein